MRPFVVQLQKVVFGERVTTKKADAPRGASAPLLPVGQESMGCSGTQGQTAGYALSPVCAF